MRKSEKSLPPHWVLDGYAKRCSICGYPLQVRIGQSADGAFAEHLRKAHEPGQRTEDLSQAALRIVREAGENK